MIHINEEVKILDGEVALVETWLKKHWNFGHNVKIVVHPDPRMSRTLYCSCGELLAIRILCSDEKITVSGTVSCPNGPVKAFDD